MLSVVCALERSHHYVYGYRATVKIDHKLLVSVWKNCILCNSPSLQKLLPRLLQNDVKMDCLKGKGNVVADALFIVSPRSTPKEGENEEGAYRGTPRRFYENWIFLTSKYWRHFFQFTSASCSKWIAWSKERLPPTYCRLLDVQRGEQRIEWSIARRPDS